MKRIILIAFSAALGLSALAQSKINAAGAQLISNYRAELQKPGTKTLDYTAEPTVTAIVILKEGFNASVFDGMDVKVVTDLNGVVTVSCPLTLTEKIAEMPEVQQVSFGEELRPMMNYARPAGQVNTAQGGFSVDGTTMKLDGKGVICGIMDSGIQPYHLNFQNEDGTSRVSRLWVMSGNNGNYTEYDAQSVPTFTTENSGTTHGTHTSGIMAGSYKGNGNYLSMSSPGGTSGSYQSGKPIPYYGIATAADLAMSCGTLTDANIIAGASLVADYAKQTGKPGVLNLSLGRNSGPHDGSDGFCQALSRIGKDIIVCISAGNEGEDNIAVTKKITAGATGNNAYLRTFPVISSEYSQVEVDFWTSDNKPVTAGWYMYDSGTKAKTKLVELSGSGSASTSGCKDFTDNFNGSISLKAAVSSANNRYQMLSTLTNVSMKPSNGTKFLFFQAGGDDNSKGQTLYLYGDGVTFSNRPRQGSSTVVGFTNGSNDGSINNMACADNVISVGAFTTRTTWGTLSRNVYGYGSSFIIDEISPFSSFGKTFSGRQLPVVCAPGAAIVSSMSRYYVSKAGETNDMTASAANGSATDYWGALQGTSMSCPYVAGTVALWLQAVPGLTYDQVMKTIEKTSSANEEQLASGRWGYGKINAVDGAKYVLQNYAGIGNIYADPDSRLIVTPTDGGYEITLAGEAQFSVSLVDMQGRTVAVADGSNARAEISTSGINPGIYVLTVSGGSVRSSQKISIR